MLVRRIRPSFSLKTLLFVVTIVAILAYQFRADRAAKLRARITAELTAAGCTALLGCQSPPGTAPEHASQEVVYVSMGGSIYGFRDVLTTRYRPTNRGMTISGTYGATRRRRADLTKLGQLPELRVLDLADRAVLPNDLRHVAGLLKLEVLLLQNTSEVTDDALRHLSGLLNLRFLDIPYSQVTDSGLEALADLTNLEHLNLHGAKITSEGLRHLQNMDKLRSLNVSNTDIDDKGIVWLRGLKSLESLTIYETGVSDAGLQHLDGLKKLTQLDVSRTDVSLDAMERLRLKVLNSMSITR